MWAEFFCLENITLKFLLILVPASLQPLQLGCWASSWGKHPLKRRWYLKMLQVSWLQKCLLQKGLQVQPMKKWLSQMWTEASYMNWRRRRQISIFCSAGVPQCHTGQMRDQFYQTIGQYYYLFLKMCSTIAKTWIGGGFTKGFSCWTTKPSALKQL